MLPRPRAIDRQPSASSDAGRLAQQQICNADSVRSCSVRLSARIRVHSKHVTVVVAVRSHPGAIPPLPGMMTTMCPALHALSLAIALVTVQSIWCGPSTSTAWHPKRPSPSCPLTPASRHGSRRCPCTTGAVMQCPGQRPFWQLAIARQTCHTSQVSILRG